MVTSDMYLYLMNKDMTCSIDGGFAFTLRQQYTKILDITRIIITTYGKGEKVFHKCIPT